MALLGKESKFMQEETERMSIGKQLWWYVVLRGGLIFGLLWLLPGFILVDVFLAAINGRWLFPYNRLIAKKISYMTDAPFLLGLVIYYFAGGCVMGFAWWIMHRIKVRRSKSAQAGLNQETKRERKVG